MAIRIRWINENTSDQRDECGNWRSVEGRFTIAPRYRHTVYPDSYEITDYMHRRDADGRFVVGRIAFDRVRDCKVWADRIIAKEQKAEKGV